MERTLLVKRLLRNMDNMHELGRQKAFELGNPFYAKFSEDGGYWRKELPTGEMFTVSFDIIYENSMPKIVNEAIIKKIK